jgi:ribosomal peptide maturation radical SAM protein 1
VASGPPHTPASADVIEKNPDPDYDEWFEDMARVGLGEDRSLRLQTFLPYESSRGCWWGEKHHCTFCGLNGEGMTYRSKSPERVLGTLHSLVERYPIRRFFAVDNILPTSYYRTFLPQLKADPLSRQIELFYEIKTNVRHEWIKLLSEAGVRYIVPGIESLSSHLLECIRKGVRAITNVHVLKLCRIYRIDPGWNLLMRIPGEHQEDYDEMAALIPKLVHFMPPFGGARKIELHRFSPYFFETDRYTHNVRPCAWYAGLFPEDQINLSRVAYYFEADWKDTLGDEAYEAVSKAIWGWVDRWREAAVLPHLHYNPAQRHGLDISDSRFGPAGLWKLDTREAALYHGINNPASARHLHDTLGEQVGSIAAVEATLQEFVAHHLAIEEAGMYLGLAIPKDVYEPPLSYRQGVLQRIGQDAERDVR